MLATGKSKTRNDGFLVVGSTSDFDLTFKNIFVNQNQTFNSVLLAIRVHSRALRTSQDLILTKYQIQNFSVVVSVATPKVDGVQANELINLFTRTPELFHTGRALWSDKKATVRVGHFLSKAPTKS